MSLSARLLAPFAREASTRSLGLLRLALGLIAWTRFGDAMLPLRAPEPDRLAASLLFFVGSTGLVLGLASRLSAALTFASLAYVIWFVGEDFDHHHTKLLAYAIGLLALGECGRSVSVDRWLAGGAAPPERGPTWPLTLLGAFVSSVYLWTAWDKTEPAFFNGVRLQQIFVETWGWSQFTSTPALDLAAAVAGTATVVVEYLLPVALWVPGWRRWAVPLGLALHGALYVLLPVSTFTVEMFALYLVFLDPDAVHVTLARLLGPADADQPPAGPTS